MQESLLFGEEDGKRSEADSANASGTLGTAP